MFISQFRNLPSAWSTLQETFFDKERLIHFLQGPGILTQRRSDSSQSHRPAFELIDNGTQYLVVYLIQPVTVNIQCLEGISGYLHIDASGTFYLSKIAYPTQQGIGNTGGSTASRSNLSRRTEYPRYRQNAG